MFSVPYPTIDERQVYARHAHRLRAEALAVLVRDIARWVSTAAR